MCNFIGENPTFNEYCGVMLHRINYNLKQSGGGEMQELEIKKLWIKWLEETYAHDSVYQELLIYNDECQKNNFTYNPFLYSYALLVYFNIYDMYHISTLDLYVLIQDERKAYGTVLSHYYKTEHVTRYLAKMNTELSRETVLNFLEGYKAMVKAFEHKENKKNT